MTLTQWTPNRIRSYDRFNRMMEEVFGAEVPTWNTWSPNVDVKETEKEYRFIMELPGMERKDVVVEINGDILTIKGERHFDHEERKEDYVCLEREYGSFKRAFNLGGMVRHKEVEATFKNGLLMVVLPKTEASAPQKIAVQNG